MYGNTSPSHPSAASSGSEQCAITARTAAAAAASARGAATARTTQSESGLDAGKRTISRSDNIAAESDANCFYPASAASGTLKLGVTAVPTRKAATEIEAGGGVDVREGQASVRRHALKSGIS